MELAEGPSLSQVIGREPMAAERVLRFAKQLCDGLRHAHEQGITHRDFKPDNVVVERAGTPEETVRIIDFGIALDEVVVPRTTGLLGTDERKRLTSTGMVFGTPAYMAPEQASGKPIDSRADLYALGVTLFEMLTGCVPFEGEGVAVARANVVQATPAMQVRVPFLDVDPLLEAFTKRLMVKAPDERVPTAAAARALLDVIERDRPGASRLLGVALPRSRRGRRTAMPPLR
jgi:serine/threonine-protein kinase